MPRPVIGTVLKDGPAAKAGLQAGDKILTVDGHKVTRFSPMGKARESIIWNVARSESADHSNYGGARWNR